MSDERANEDSGERTNTALTNADHKGNHKKKVRRASRPLSAKPASDQMTIDQRRLRQLDKLQLDALQAGSPLQGALQGATGDLLSIGHHMTQSILAALDPPIAGPIACPTPAPLSTAALEQLSPAIELLLRVSRQADRLASLDQRIDESQHAQLSTQPATAGSGEART